MEAGKLSLERTPFRLETLVRDTLAVISPLASAKNLEMRTALQADLPPALIGDPQRLRQVLLNLLSNAVKFTASGSITVGVSACQRNADSAELQFTVQDTGIGIPREVQQTIFEPFTQADSSTTRRYGGTGLGLTICRRLIALMDGKLELESEPGRGSTFRFTANLSIGTPSAAPAAPHRDRLPRSSRNLRILLAEDNAINQKVAVRLLQQMGHQVDVALDGRQAVAAVQRSEYDMVLMDCQMPEMDGYAATRAIRELECGRNIPIIAITANAMAEDRQRCLEAGMDAYLAKPISPDQLHDVVEAFGARQIEGDSEPLALPSTVCL
jgi:CheY-like chemotaxis protein